MSYVIFIDNVPVVQVKKNKVLIVLCFIFIVLVIIYLGVNKQSYEALL